jgi:hypothetical protein
MAELVYEMVWDCRFCGATKLLGLTHRHCPSCGAQQDPNTRYFPADHEKVAVQDHAFYGADIACRYCQAPSSRRAHHCGQCGAALAEGSAVPLHVEPGSQEMAYAAGPASEPPKRPLWKIALPVTALAAVVVAVLLIVWKKEQRFVVAERSWSRSVSVERLGSVRQSAWCDELPATAADVSRRREQRGVKQVASGEDCRLQREDQGDGTFKERQVCTPRHADQPVYAEKCDFVVAKWAALHQQTVEGRLGSAPRWPDVTLTKTGCEQLGCEREGARSETYTVVLKDAAGESYRCNFDEQTWQSYADGATYTGKLRALVGTLDCSSLRKAR